MQKYGYLLDDFDNNGKYMNDCIFTMMHHIGGDIDNVSTLFQPKILKTFSKIWNSGYDMCDVSLFSYFYMYYLKILNILNFNTMSDTC